MTQPLMVAVAGGSSGIGLACAKQYAKRGAEIAIIGRNGKKLGYAKRDINQINPDVTVHTVQADLSVFDETKAAFEALQAMGFIPDILINSAGVIFPGEFMKMTHSGFDSNIESGYWTVVNPCRVVAPLMRDRHSGHIVNISSVAGYMGIYGYTGYSSAKFATFGFTEALRSEMKPEGVSVHLVCPPDTETPALAYERTLRPAETDAIAGSLKAVSPDYIAKAIIKGIDKEKYLIIPGFISKLYFRLKGIWPEIFFAITDADVRKVRKEQAKRTSMEEGKSNFR